MQLELFLFFTSYSFTSNKASCLKIINDIIILLSIILHCEKAKTKKLLLILKCVEALTGEGTTIWRSCNHIVA